MKLERTRNSKQTAARIRFLPNLQQRKSRMDRMVAMGMFVKAVETGSLSAAARALDQSLPAVSRGISALEQQLGGRLLVRTTRRISLTEAGRTYYERAKRVLGDLREAEAEVAREHSVPSGRLVVSASVTFGRFFMGGL